MQFSVLTTVTGTATVTGGLLAVLPLGGPASGYQINPSSDFSGGPTFTVANQVDKEFYQGILTPVDNKTIDYLFQAGYPKQLLLTLFVSKISFPRTDESGAPPKDFLNRPDCPRADQKGEFLNRADCRYFPYFQEVIGELINEGIRTERSESTEEIGPPLTSVQAAQMDGISKLTAEGLNLDKTKKSGKPSTFQISKSKIEYQFCFATMHKGHDKFLHEKLLNLISLSEIDAHACVKKHNEVENLTCDHRRKFDQNEVCDNTKAKRHEKFELTIRSTLGIIYYLGEIARGNFRPVPEHFEAPTLLFPEDLAHPGPDKLFTLSMATGDPALTVNYEGVDYSVPRFRPDYRDHSSQVLDLVEQLAALNSSNKNLPSSSVVNLVGH